MSAGTHLSGTKRKAGCAQSDPPEQRDTGSTRQPTLFNYFKVQKLMPPAQEEQQQPAIQPPLSSTVACPPLTNAKTSLAKSNSSSKPTPKVLSLRTLRPDSTSTDVACVPFWSASIKTLSQESWCPTRTGLRDLAWNSWSGYSAPMASRSWFTAKLQAAENRQQTNPLSSAMTYSPSRRTLLPETTAADPLPTAKPDSSSSHNNNNNNLNEDDDDNDSVAEEDKCVKVKAQRCRLIRVYPDQDQRKILTMWFGTARWTYNKCLDAVTKEGVAKTKKALRDRIVNNKNHEAEGSETKWVVDTPYEVRDGAMDDLLEAYKSNFAKKKKDPTFTFEIKYRSKKKCKSEAIYIRAGKFANGKPRNYHKGGFYTKFFGEKKLASKEPLPDRWDYDLKLIRNRLNEYYLAFPSPLQVIELSEDGKKVKRMTKDEWARAGDKQVRSTNGPKSTMVNDLNNSGESERVGVRVAALDPGIRVFNTVYDPTRECVYSVGDRDIEKIYELCRRMDKWQSQWGKVTSKKRRNLKRAYLRTQKRVRNMVDEVHKKLALFLVINYDIILLPKFETQQMAKKNKTQVGVNEDDKPIMRCQRKINSKAVRGMMTWSHYRFRMRLIEKAKERNGACLIFLVNEAYTSKTCGKCGHIHQKLGGNKLFKCPKCHFTIDRDVNGARNIYLRNAKSVGLSH
jgi:putative transposase